jgi:hypothetical protein
MLTVRRLVLLAAFVYTQFFWTRTLGVLPPGANWIDDVVALALGALALAQVPRPSGLSTAWAWLLAAFVGIGVVSAIANGVPWWRAALGLRGLLVYLGVYYGVVTSKLSREDVQRVFVVLLVLMALQPLVQLLQFSMGVTRFGLDFEMLADIAPGTLGPGLSNDLGLLYLPFIVGAFCMFLVRRSAFWVVVGAAFALGLVLCSARAALLMLPPCLALSAVLWWGWRSVLSPRSIVVAGLMLLLVGGIGNAYYRATTGSGLLTALSPARLVQEQVAYSPEAAGRLAFYPVTWAVLTTEAASPWIGLGPGNYGSGAGYVTNAPGLSLIRNVFGQFETNRETALNSQFLATLGEFGILGVAVFLMLLLSLARRTLLVLRAERDDVVRATLIAVFVGQVVFVLGGFVELAWETQPLSFTFWLVAGLVTQVAQARLRGSAENTLPANRELV